MTVPTSYPSKYSGTDADYNKVKADYSGAVRQERFSTAIADNASVGTLVGCTPFNKGFGLVQGASQFHVTDGDTATTVTFNVGYIYDDNTTYTNDTDAFASALTTAQAGGLVTFDEHAGIGWVAEANGWIVAEIAAGPVTTACTLKGQVVGSYDG